MSVLFARVFALTSPATLARRTVGFVGAAGSAYYCALATADTALVDAVGQSIAHALNKTLIARLAALQGSDFERLSALAAENRFRLQLGKPERGASDDVERAARALLAAEVEGETPDRLRRRFGVVAVAPRLLNSWSLLELLAAAPYIATKTKLQKMLFHLQESLEVDALTAPRFRFKRYVYGPYASGVDSVVAELVRLEVVEVSKVETSSRFEITDRGRLLVGHLRAIAPNYEHLHRASTRVVERFGSMKWSAVKEVTYADPLVRGRPMNAPLLPLDSRAAGRPGLGPDPGDDSTRDAVSSGNSKALLH